MYLSALLKGRALDVYSMMPTEYANDYDQLKDALLKRLLPEEGGLPMRLSSPSPCCVDIVRAAVAAAAAAAVFADLIYMHV